MSESTSNQRENWKTFECNKAGMVMVPFGPDRVLVAPPTVAAWEALATVFLAHGYELRTPDTDSYNCRDIKGGGGKSLHSYGIALDVNWHTNPYKKTPDNRAVVFSSRATQSERAEDVRRGVADTDMTRAMIDDVLAIKTGNGKRVFEWGGYWTSIKDTMHFEIDVAPADLQTGINAATVKKAGPGVTWGQMGASAGDSSVLAFGSRGPKVEELQRALAALGLPVGEIDGIFGSDTRAAVVAFQGAQGLTQTGMGENATLLALGITSAGASAIGDDKALAAVIDALAAVLAGKTGGTTTPASAPAPANLIQILLSAFLGRAVPGLQPGSDAVKAVSEATLSPIDKMLGGSALTGKKTPLAVLGYSLLTVLQGVGVVGSATPTGLALNAILLGFGGLGVLSKVDRVTNLLGLLAAARQSGAGKQT